MFFDKMVAWMRNKGWFGMIELKNERKNEIEELAFRIRSEYDINLKFDLIKFLTNYQGFEIRLQYIDDDTTGLIFANDNESIQKTNSKAVIIINEKLREDKFFEQKKRFICAHEYGHYVLHKGNSTKFARRDTGAKKTQEELEAEYFAFCFLLPKKTLEFLFQDDVTKKVIDELKNIKKQSYSEVIATLFNVTPKKAHARLKELGLIDG